MFKFKYLSKRMRMIYIIIFLWLLLGLLSIWRGVELSQISWYFTSLTTYVGTYILSETFKKSKQPTNRLPKSKREQITYICIFIWLVVGIYGIFAKIDLTKLAGYFTSLSSFIAIYILGQHLRSSDEEVVSLFNKENTDNKKDTLLLEKVDI